MRRMPLVAFCIPVLVVVPATGEARTRTLSIEPVVGGTVTSTDHRIHCGTDCTAHYRKRSTVMLRARPDADFLFVRWTGDCVSTADRCLVALTRRTTVRATFVRRQRTVRVMVGGPGTVTADTTHVRCGSAGDRCNETAGQGATLKIIATPDAGAVFDQWSAGPCVGTVSPTCEVVVQRSGRLRVGAVFRHALPVAGSVTLNVKRFNTEVRSTPAGLQCAAVCTASYASGSHVTLRSKNLSAWSDGCVGFGTKCTVVMDAPVAVDVRRFFPPGLTDGRAYGLTVSVTGPGTVVGQGLRCGGATGTRAACDNLFTPNKVVRLRAIPARGARLVRWTGFCTGRTRQCLVRMSATKIVGAMFRR